MKWYTFHYSSEKNAIVDYQNEKKSEFHRKCITRAQS